MRSCVILISFYLGELANVQLFNSNPVSLDVLILKAFGKQPVSDHLWKECTDLN